MTERIDLTSERIVRAFLEDVGNYVPVIPRSNVSSEWVGEEEGGVTVVSSSNLERLTNHLRAWPGSKPIAVLARSNGAFVIFENRDAGPQLRAGYLATGFSFGYRGEGPHGFARYLEAVIGHVPARDALDVVADIPPGWEGVVWARPDVWPSVDLGAEWREDVAVSLRALWPGFPSEVPPPANLARSGAPQDDASERRAAARFGAAVRDRLRRGR